MRHVLVSVALSVAAVAGQQNAAPRPQILGLAHVRVLTSDIQKAKAFYGGVLGYPEVLQANGQVAIFRVNDRQRIIVRAGLPPDRDDRFVDVAFETDDVKGAQDLLKSRGLQASYQEDAGEAEGRAVETPDPDGHRVRLVQLVTEPMRVSQQQPDRRIAKRILHAGLTIKNAGAADRFYKDALGFSEIWRGGRPEGVVNWINMRVPDGTDYLEYMLYPAAPPTRQQLGSAHHAALLVTDIQAALEQVRARTAPDDRNHRATPAIGVNRRWQLNVYDPDGTRIEFMEPWTVR